MKSPVFCFFLFFVFLWCFSFGKKNDNVNKEDGRRKETFSAAQGRNNERKNNRKHKHEQKIEHEKERSKGPVNTARFPGNQRKLQERKAGQEVEQEKKLNLVEEKQEKEEEKTSILDLNSLRFRNSPSFNFTSRNSFIPPPRLMRFPYRQSSDEILRFPDSVGLEVRGEPSSEEVEANSKEIANTVNIQMKTLKKGRVMIALTDLTHPLYSFNEKDKHDLILKNNNKYNSNFMNNNDSHFNDYDIEKDPSIYDEDDEDRYSEEEKLEIKSQANNSSFTTKNERKFKGRRQNEEIKRLQQLRENIRTELNIDMLKMEGIVKEARLLDNIGLLVIDFDENAKEEQIKDTLKLLWYLNKGIWLIEADADITFRRKSDFYNVSDEYFVAKLEDTKRNSIFRKEKDVDNGWQHEGILEDNNYSYNENNRSDVETKGNVNSDNSRKYEEEVFIEERKEESDLNNSEDMSEDALKYYYGDYLLQNSSNVQSASTLNFQISAFMKFLANLKKKSDRLEDFNYENFTKHEENMHDKSNEENNRSNATMLKGDNAVLQSETDFSKREANEEDFEMPNDSYFHYQWGLYNKESRIDIRFLEAWKLTKNLPKTPVVVAHIDTGVDLTHSDLSEKIWVNEDEIMGNGIDDDGNGYKDDIHGWNFEAGNTDIRDKHGHGTHTAGILGAITNNNNGISGISDSVKIMVLKFHNMASDAVAAIEYSLKKKAFASTNSWGFSAPVESLRLAIEKARSYGQLFICAVDNSGSDNTWYGDYPPNWQIDNMIRVASLTSKGMLDRTSNYGRNNVDLAAPGRNILSTVPSYIYNNKHYAYKDGTSMATPFVAGVAALLKSIKPNLTANEIRNAIMSSVTVLKSLNNKVVSRGMLNAENAVKHVLGIHYVRNQEVDVSSSYYDRHPSFILPYAYGLTSFLNKLRFNVTSN